VLRCGCLRLHSPSARWARAPMAALEDTQARVTPHRDFMDLDLPGSHSVDRLFKVVPDLPLPPGLTGSQVGRELWGTAGESIPERASATGSG